MVARAQDIEEEARRRERERSSGSILGGAIGTGLRGGRAARDLRTGVTPETINPPIVRQPNRAPIEDEEDEGLDAAPSVSGISTEAISSPPNRVSFRTRDNRGVGTVASEDTEGIARVRAGLGRAGSDLREDPTAFQQAPITPGGTTSFLSTEGVNLNLGAPTGQPSDVVPQAQTNSSLEEAQRILQNLPSGRFGDRRKREALQERARTLSEIGRAQLQAQTASRSGGDNALGVANLQRQINRDAATQEQRDIENRRAEATIEERGNESQFRRRTETNRILNDFIEDQFPDEEDPRRERFRAFVGQFGLEDPADVPQTLGEARDIFDAIGGARASDSFFDPGVLRQIFGDEPPTLERLDQFDFSTRFDEETADPRFVFTEQDTGREFDIPFEGGLFTPGVPSGLSGQAERLQERARREREQRRERFSR